MLYFRALKNIAFCMAVLLVIGGCAGKNEAESIRTIPWALTGAWLIGDLHTHSRFSDGALTAENLIERAVLSGCEVLALTDHADLTGNVKTAGPGYLSTLRQLRQRYPGLILIGGLEWNIAPYEGREHVNLLVEPSIESEILPAFREQFDSVRLPGEDTPSAEQALDWLSARVASSAHAVLFYNHPSRKVETIDSTGTDLTRWRRANKRMIGFEGAPGHQRSSVIGSYDRRFETTDRWDPVAANIGGVWDALLDQGDDVWAALANSDYHNDKLDYPPCAFSRVHFQVPEPSQQGVLEALEAGSFWAEHGPILNDLLFIVNAHGLELPAVPGEAISVHSNQAVSFHLAIERDTNAMQHALLAEFISNCRSGTPELVSVKTLAPDETQKHWELENVKPGRDGESCYARLRIRKQVENEPDLLAYTNPIRVMID